MACMAEDQRFPAAGGHDLYPSRLLPTCVLFQVFECSDVVGSGAVVPCGDHPSPALRTVRAACHRTRLALYVLLEILFGRRACQHEVGDGKSDRGPGFSCGGLPSYAARAPFLLLHLSAFGHDAPQMALESFHDFGGAAGPDISVGWYIYRESRYFAVLLRRKNATGSTHRKMENTPIRQARRSLIDPLTLRSV